MASPEVTRVELEVQGLHRNAGHQNIDIVARYRVRGWKAGQSLHLLNFAESLSEPTHLDRLAAMQHLQSVHVPAALNLRWVRTRGRTLHHRRVGARRDIVLELRSPPPPAEQPMLVEIAYRLKVPRRPWPFGCVRGHCALAGAVAPLPAQRIPGSSEFTVTPTHWQVTWPQRAQRPSSLYIDDSSAGSDRALFFPHVGWASTGHARLETSQFHYRGVLVRIWGARGQDIEDHRDDGPWPWRRNIRMDLAAQAREAIDMGLRFGLKPGWGDTLSIMVGPLFSDVSRPEGQSVLVSSNYLDVVPLKRFASFHRAQLRRSLMDALVLQHLTKRGHRPDHLWLTGALGRELTRRAGIYSAEHTGDLEDAVSSIRFMPMVDQMLYGGQTSNAGAFFSSAPDPLPLRNHSLYFSNSLPRGGRMAVKLGDALGAQGFETWVDEVISEPDVEPRKLARELARTVAKKPIEPGFFPQWLGPYPKVDYAVESFKNHKAKAGWRCEVHLLRQSDQEIHETVDVQVTFRDKSTKMLVWSPRGTGRVRGTLEFHGTSRVKSITLDPDGKLVQKSLIPGRRWEKEAYTDPLFNDRKPAGLRFLYTGVGFHMAFAEFFSAKTGAARLRALDGYLSFAASLRRDLRREFSLLIAKDRDTLINLGGGMAFFFGPKVVSNRRRWKLAGDSEIDFLTQSGLDKSSGIRLTQSLSLLDDTRVFLFDPQYGHTFKLTLKRSDVWAPLRGSQRQHTGFWRLSVNLAQRFRIAHGHILALQGVGEMVFNKNVPEFRGLARAGGLGRLSAFGADEIFARAVAVGLVEYRHTLIDHVRGNLMGLTWLRNFGGAVMGGVGTASSCDDFSGFGAKDSWYGQVGYGLTSLHDFLGLAPQFVRVDVSVPIGRKYRTCLGRAFPNALAQAQNLPMERVNSLLPKFSFNLSIEQPF